MAVDEAIGDTDTLLHKGSLLALAFNYKIRAEAADSKKRSSLLPTPLALV